MPVSVVCESTANAVNAALRDSLGVGSCAGNSQQQQQLHNGGIGANRAANASANLGSRAADDDDDDTVDSLQNRLVANAKRVLLSKIEYEEVDNYNQTVLDNLKSKYIIIKPNEYQHQIGANFSAVATCRNNTNGHDSSAGDTTNGHAHGNSKSPATNGKQQPHQSQQIKQLQPNPNELPSPKRILFARENVRIGWKGTSGPSGRKWNVGVGMINVGNTCYLNSTLQALFHVPSLANWLLSDSAHMERCDTADAGCIICAMSKTLHASQSNQSSIRPYLVYSKLKSICKHMVMGRQEDAHEFLRFLVEAMEKSYLSRFRNYKDLEQYSKETTPLNQILGGYLKSAVRCLSCNHVSVTFQHFQDLLLDIRKADSIEEALEGYFSRERLEDTGYKCEACKKKVSATKQFSLERAPITLCIQLKRFSIVGTKLNKQITIKPRLDLTKFASRKTPGDYPLTYKLVAMVTHLGVSQHCGHYTAIGLTESGTYYNYDDNYVRPISVQSVCNTNAYIIFYEMDNTASLRTYSPPSSTQVSGAISPKLNGVRATNGHMSPSPQRMIGPQLPPGGMASYTKSPSPALITTPNGKQNGQRQIQNQVTPNGSNKITIHFKNGHASLVKANGVNASASNPATSTTQQQQNGLLMGASKFQEPTHSKSSLVCTTNKGQTFTNANSNKSSSNNASSYSSDDDDYDDDVINVSKVSSSSTATTAATSSQCQRKVINTNTNCTPTLPSMPGLFDGLSNGKKTGHNGIAHVAKQQLKSLVPYESATDDEDSVTASTATVATTSTGTTSATVTTDTYAKRLDNPLKRPSSASSSLSSDDNDDDEKDQLTTSKSCKPTANGKMSKKAMKNTRLYNSAASPTPALSSKVNNINNNNSNSNHKQKTDAIEEIFNAHKRNGNNSPTKKQKVNQLQVSSTTPNSDSSGHDDESNDDTSNDEDDNNNTNGVISLRNGNGVSSAARTTLRPIKRTKSKTPSPPVIKTKVGIWQVTQNDEDDDDEVDNKTKPLPAKNLKNPFSNKSSLCDQSNNTKRPKANAASKQDAAKRNGNGYQLDAQTDGTVNELLKQSHRGYGASVLTWNGTQTEIEKEVIAEAREQRQRDWEHEEENDEHDRGRQSKTAKTTAAKQSNSVFERTPGYNPFQEAENQKRWHKGGFYHHRSHNTTGGNFRHHFHQRNKFKFNRYGNGSAGGAGSKFQQQRALQRHVANVGGSSGRRNDAS